MAKHKTCRIISLDVNQLSYGASLEKVLQLAQSKTSAYVCFANSHMVVEAAHDPKFAEMVNAANLILPDGMPLSRSFKLLYGISQERIPGMSFLPDLLVHANRLKLKIFLIGSTDEVLEKTQSKIKSLLPDIAIVGRISPPFDSQWNDEDYFEQINNSKPDLAIVSLGCPKQEKWMAQAHMNTKATFIGIGAALPVFAGTLMKTPRWMSKNGLEWLFRLIQEPRRLFKRYLITNSLFIYYLNKQYLNSLFKSTKNKLNNPK